MGPLPTRTRIVGRDLRRTTGPPRPAPRHPRMPPFGKKLGYAANRAELHIPERFADPSVRMSAALDLALCDKLDELIGTVELYLTRSAKIDDVQTYHRLRTVPGVGPILALVLLYEMHNVARFEQVGQ